MYNYPVQMKPYLTSQNLKLVKHKEDNESSSSSDIQDEQREHTYKNFKKPSYPNGESTAIDYSKSKINISQVVEDFKKTTSAISAPPDIQNEVDTYLSLIEKQSSKEFPNQDVIKANLISASKVLDEYIAKSLNKKSNVVENWIDALFLQHIEYKANPNENNPAFRVQLPEKKQEEVSKQIEGEARTPQSAQMQEQSSSNINASKTKAYIPQDPNLRRMFVQAKKYSAIQQDEKAFESFRGALNYAKEINDTQAQSIIHYEVGRLYDNYDAFAPALKNYHQAIEKTQDLNVKARAHIAMAQIYDDVVEFEPAMNHYFASMSFAGESDNLNAQTKALTNIGKMYCERYDKSQMENYFGLATDIVQETKSDKSIAKVYSTYADSLGKVNEKTKALSFYSKGAKHYLNSKSLDGVAHNYEKASDVMLELGNKAKAKNLLLKARKIYFETNQPENLTLVGEKLKNL